MAKPIDSMGGLNSLVFVDGDPRPDLSTTIITEERGQRVGVHAAGIIARKNLLVSYLQNPRPGVEVVDVIFSESPVE